MTIDLFTLGELYPSDFLEASETPRSSPVELRLQFDEDTKIVHLSEAAPHTTMFGRYWYRSGVNATMTAELTSIATSVQSAVRLDDDDIWLDIACNDGTLLGAVDPRLIRVGIDPADDTFVAQSQVHADVIVQDVFSRKAWDSTPYADRGAKVITCIAMFYDLLDPTDFLADAHDILDDDGLFVLQMSYTPLMLHQVAFDNICHEHLRYYTMRTLSSTLAAAGFGIVDVQLNSVNGGSFRVYAMKHDADRTKFATQPERDVGQFRLEAVLSHEERTAVNTPEVWDSFFRRMIALRDEVREFIGDVRQQGKTVWAYGASTKGNTLLQFFDLDDKMIGGIAERSTYKFGLRTVGTNIPITSEADMRAADPDYLLVLPWHFISEFVQRESAYLASGGQFIVPCPEFKIVGA